MSNWLQIQSEVRQGDSFAPFLFNLCLEPFLNLLDSYSLSPQAYADDVACCISSKHMLAHLLKASSLYESATGAKLNKSKSVMLGNPSFPTSFTCKQSEKYLGFTLTSKCTLVFPSDMLDNIIKSLVCLKNLYFSLLHKITILKSYIRPKVLYIASLACTSHKFLLPYAKAENWFLSSCSVPLLQMKRTAAFLKYERQMHPLVSNGLLPINMACCLRKATTLVSIVKNNPNQYNVHDITLWISDLSLIPPGCSFELNICAFKKILQLLPDSCQFADFLDKDLGREVYKSLTLMSFPLTRGQTLWKAKFGTNFAKLLKITQKLPIWGHIQSFLWKLTNRIILQIPNPCLLCHSAKVSIDHIFGLQCSKLTNIWPSAPLYTWLQMSFTKSSVINIVLQLWALWKVYCCVTYENPIANIYLFLFFQLVEKIKTDICLLFWIFISYTTIHFPKCPQL